MTQHQKNRIAAAAIALTLMGLIAALTLATIWRIRRGARTAGTAPAPLPIPETAEPANAFDFPLDPDRFGPYIPYVSGDFAVDTRYDVQNPGVGDAGKCFVNIAGKRVPFSQLYHAGEDWFALDGHGKVRGRGAAGEPVRAVANGLVTWVQSLGSDGYVLIIEHTPTEGSAVWSVYWHAADPQVAQGQAVTRGQVIAAVHDRGFNSHLHWEIRTFADATDHFPADSAGGRGTCNGYVAGVGYTWDDAPARAHPDFWGYLNPGAYIEQRRATEK